jgi:hypothetical protein
MDAVIRVYDDVGNVIATHEQATSLNREQTRQDRASRADDCRMIDEPAPISSTIPAHCVRNFMCL